MHSSSKRLHRLTPLATCLATALGLGSVSTPLLAVTTWTVLNCTDSGGGSLRYFIDTKAQSGDTVDLSQLPVTCNMVNSTITLTSGEIEVKQNDLKLQGPTVGTVAISGNHASRVFDHTGTGTLSIDELTTKDGTWAVPGNSYGGCIRSLGNVNMTRSSVAGCVASGSGFAYGGGIFVAGQLNLVSSTVSGNEALGGQIGLGGGVYARGGFVAKYSTITLNQASKSGGGVRANNHFTIGIFNSTVSGNYAGSYGGGLYLGGSGTQPSFITNSTISGNTAQSGGAAIMVANQPVTISNTTVALNHAANNYNGTGGGLGHCCNPVSITLQSSIFAGNTTGNNSPSDIGLSQNSTIAGGGNLVISSNIAMPADTLTSDPKLGPLRFNGGPTQTHALLPGSPAIGVGNNAAGYSHDQRGHGYPRTTGASASVDIGAFQFDSIFAYDFE